MRSALFFFGLLHSTLGACQRTMDLRAAEPDMRGIHIAVDTVVLGFAPNAPLGTLHAAVSGNDKRLSSDGPIDKALAVMLRRSLPTDGEAWHVGLKVNVLQVEDHMIGKKEVAFCSLHIEFLERTDSGWVRCYDHGTTMSSERASMDRWDHNHLLAMCIEEIFAGAWHAHQRDELRRTPTPLNDLLTPAIALDLPITRTSGLQPGIFKTFQDFRLNRIDTTIGMAGFDVTLTDGTPIRGTFGKSSTALQKTAWGCSDGERLYMNAGSFYLPLLWDGNDFTARVPLGDVAMGVGIGGVGLSGVMFSRSTMVTETTARVDLLSGRIEPLLDKMANGEPSRARCYFVYSKHSAVDTSTCLFVFGGRETCLRPGQHYRYEPLRRSDALPVELRCSSGALHTVYLDTKVLYDQAILIKTKRDGALVVDVLSTMMAEGIIHELQESDRAEPAP